MHCGTVSDDETRVNKMISIEEMRKPGRDTAKHH
jgi:hypothetical protein